MRPFYPLFFLLLLATAAYPQNPLIVKTVNSTVLEPKNKSQDDWENNGWAGKYFYQGTGTPIKLCVTDGTTAGTQYLKDLTGDNLLHTLPARDFIYLITRRTTGTYPNLNIIDEIWRSDGTPAGTYLVKALDAYPFLTQATYFCSDNQNRRNYSVAGNELFFAGWDAANGQELWRTDGTLAGTYLVKDIRPGTAASGAKNFIRMPDGYVYFKAASSGLGTTLWRTDGTAAGTTEIAVPNLTIVGNEVGYVNGKMIFYGNDNFVSGYEPWVSDGTVGGTFRLADINPGAGNSSSSSVQNVNLRFNDKYCFFIAEVGGARNLWRTDGTIAGTIQLSANGLIANGENNFSGGGYCAVSNTGVYWLGSNNKLYFSNGTVAGTRLIRSDLQSAVHLYQYKGAAWFKNTTGNTSLPATLESEPWRSDGSSANTARALDVYTGMSGAFINSSNPFGYFSLNNKLYFFGSRLTGGGNLHLFEYNGDMTFSNAAATNRWRDSANWNSNMPPALTDTAYINTGFMVNVDGAKAYAGRLVAQSGSTINLVSASDSLFVGDALQASSFSGNGVLVLRNINGDTVKTTNAFSVANINVDGKASLANDLTVTNNLNLTSSARLFANAANIVLSGNASSITTTANSYVVTNGAGALVFEGVGSGGRSGAVVFPVGTTTYYNPATLTNTGTADAFSVRVQPGINSVYSGETPTGGAYSSGAVNATWFIKEAIAGSSNATVELSWNAAQELSGFDRTQSRIGHYTAGAWQNSAAGAAAGSNPYSFSGSGYTSFSPFGVLNSGATLPIRAITLRLQKTGSVHRCSWTIIGEEGKTVSLERSNNGVTYAPVYAAAYRTVGSYEDANTSTGKLFYRLRVTDKNGIEKLSNVVWSESSNALFAVYPTQVAQQLFVQYNGNEDVVFGLYATDGRLILQKRLQSGTNNIPAQELLPQVYLYRITANGQIMTSGFLQKQ